MEKLGAIFICLVLTSSFYLVYQFAEKDKEQVMIVRVIDGDTFVLEDGRTIRLLNINSPEKKTFAAQEATDFLEELVGKDIEIEVTGMEKYGRFLARAYVPEYLNLEIVNRGFASIFLVDDSETRKFYKTQEKAILEGVGMWKHSQYFGCLDAEINKKDEFVDFEVNCKNNLLKWSVKDESTKTYTIKRSISEDFMLYSYEGEDSEAKRFWNEGNVWNNDRDSIFVRDEKGELVFYESYGY
ncbi:MAG: thermonuclease family protein [Nanoarchaeota archaeon]